MDRNVEIDGCRYWAFISYSHKDAAFGRRLHRRLESYALPRSLVGRPAASGGVTPRRLAPIFRDREELPAAQDLSAEVRAALNQSRSLIVVCSPAAAASPWVAREVELFRELHPGRPVFAAIREGQPKDSMPPVMHLLRDDGEPIEPLAADFRRGHDGWEMGVLKLVAGVVGVGLDELARRDAQRRAQRVTAITAGALLAMVVMAVLTAFAVSARSEAERQRAEAEGLVRFMHTDLRDALRGLARTDLLAAVNARALDYYDRESGEQSPQQRAQRAQVLQAIGEDYERQAKLDLALPRFLEAWRITKSLMDAAPNDPETLFDHAQSEYWLGVDKYERGQLAAAKAHFDNYLALARRMLALSGDTGRYWRELSFAEGNLCSVALQPPSDPVAALRLCTIALVHMKRAAQSRPPLAGIEVDLSDKESWIGTAYKKNGDIPHALEHWNRQQVLLDRLFKHDPLNADRRSEWVALQRNFARAEAETGHRDHARERLRNAVVVLDEILLLDPTNAFWTHQRLKLMEELRKVIGH